MDGTRLQDIIAQGLGTAARAIGVLCDAFRPSEGANPLASVNRFLQLSAAFNPRDPGFRNAGLPGNAVWYGVFDSAYLVPGDYLVEQVSGRIWFVAALQNLLPATCVLTNCVLTVTRPSTAGVAGVNAYGGGTGSTAVVAGFPGNLLHGGSSRAPGAIPADARIGEAVALLPAVSAAPFFARGDLVTDDLGRSFVVSGAELNALGWRLDLRQAAS
jgi:hypothetical protein